MNRSVTIIGAGPGGYLAAVRAAQLGAEVTIVEQGAVGGTCLNRGCIPSKTMKTAAQLLEDLRRAEIFGMVREGRAAWDMDRLMKRKEKVIQDQAHAILRLLKKHRIRLIEGTGLVREPGQTLVTLADGQLTTHSSDRLILATGSEPMNLPELPFDGQGILSSTDALNLRQVPESLLIVGGGVIGSEFAFIFSALGSQVTVVEAMDRILPLPSIDPDCSKIIEREMKKRKIQFLPNRKVEKAAPDGDQYRVTIGPFSPDPHAKESDKIPQTVMAEKILVCVGRCPCTAPLELDRLGIETDPGGWIVVDPRMQTTVPHVYAIGDVLGPTKHMMAHVATTEGLIAAENAMGNPAIMTYDAVPVAVYTLPEVAAVGLTEPQAKEKGHPARSDSVMFRNLGKSQVTGLIEGMAKIVWEEENGRILGVHLVGAHATDLIAEGTLALNRGCTVEEVAGTIHAHPTLAEIMSEAAHKAMGRALHG
jgi:dihydrolipoamide dehydrogenase